jgi:hypothetical protein
MQHAYTLQIDNVHHPICKKMVCLGGLTQFGLLPEGVAGSAIEHFEVHDTQWQRRDVLCMCFEKQHVMQHFMQHTSLRPWWVNFLPTLLPGQLTMKIKQSDMQTHHHHGCPAAQSYVQH